MGLETRRPRFCAFCRIAGSCTWEGFRKFRSMCASLPQPTSTCARWCAMGDFREDLFYRLNVITSNFRRLRQRKEDIPLLVEFFLKKYAEENARSTPRVTPEALRPLMAYSWPGNVRELENVIERAVVLSSGPEITMDLLPESLMGARFFAYAARSAFGCVAVRNCRRRRTDASSPTCSNAATGIRRKQPNASTYLCLR